MYRFAGRERLWFVQQHPYRPVRPCAGAVPLLAWLRLCCLARFAARLRRPAPITTLGAECFSSCYSLKGTELSPNKTITQVGAYAFSRCTSLIDPGLDGNNTVASLGEGTFAQCHNLPTTGLTTNTSITAIPPSCYFQCFGLISTGCNPALRSLAACPLGSVLRAEHAPYKRTCLRQPTSTATRCAVNTPRHAPSR